MNELVKAMEELYEKREVTHPCVIELQWLRNLCDERPTLNDAQWDRLALIACELTDIYAKGFNAGLGLLRKHSNIEPAPVVRANGVKPKRIPTGMTKEKAAKHKLPLDFSLGDLGL